MIVDKERLKKYKEAIKVHKKELKNEHKRRKKYIKEIIKIFGDYCRKDIGCRYVNVWESRILINSSIATYNNCKKFDQLRWEKFKEACKELIDKTIDSVLPKEPEKPKCSYCGAELRGEYCSKCGMHYKNGYNYPPYPSDDYNVCTRRVYEDDD